MKTRAFQTTGVGPTGKVKDGGAVCVKGDIRFSAPGGGCGAGTCNCSDGHWISIVGDRTPEGTVSGHSVRFDDLDEMRNAAAGIAAAAGMVALSMTKVSDALPSLDTGSVQCLAITRNGDVLELVRTVFREAKTAKGRRERWERNGRIYDDADVIQWSYMPKAGHFLGQ